VENFSGWKFVATFALYIAFNAALVFSSAFIVTQFAPAAAGSGIPEIKAYLNGTSHLFVFFLFFFK
jgi:chloride channel 7